MGFTIVMRGKGSKLVGIVQDDPLHRLKTVSGKSLILDSGNEKIPNLKMTGHQHKISPQGGVDIELGPI